MHLPSGTSVFSCEQEAASPLTSALSLFAQPIEHQSVSSPTPHSRLVLGLKARAVAGPAMRWSIRKRDPQALIKRQCR